MFMCCCPASNADNTSGFVEQLSAAGGAADVAADEKFPPDGFTAELRRERGREVGARLEAVQPSPALYISSVSDDPSTVFGAYNAGAPEHLRIRAGDFITAAGGTTDLARMKERMMKAPVCDITVQRPQMLEATVPKGGRPLGLEIKYEPNGTSIAVTKVVEGAARVAGADVRPGDRIVAVNGEAGPVSALLTLLKVSESPKLTIARADVR